MNIPLLTSKVLGVLCAIMLLWICCAFSQEISIPAIIEIESSGNPHAYNKKSGCRGLMQISEVAFKDFCVAHKFEKIPDELLKAGVGTSCSLYVLYIPECNKYIGTWYINKRIKQDFLKGKGTVDDVLICYNWGYGNWRKWKRGEKKLPRETRNYIKKYHKLTEKK